MRFQRPEKREAVLAILGLVMLVGPSRITAQTAGGRPPTPQSAGSLVDRQKSIHDRFTRLESTMLKLSKTLAQAEPEKADRIRDGLDLAGRQRIKARAEALVALLK